ncbi:MAG: endonuclease/exonuclease/phosphatase family protein [Pseudomonadota bacterium]
MLDGIRGVASLLATLGIVAVVAGYFGDAHPAFDTLGAGRLHAAIAFAALLLFSTAFAALTARLLAFTGLVAAGAGIVPSYLPGDPVVEVDLSVYSHNLRFNNSDLDGLLAQIETVEADVLLLQEVSRENAKALRRLERGRWRLEICPFAAVGGVALMTQGAEEIGCEPGQGLAWARIPVGGEEVTVATLHLPWPWPHGQAPQAERIAELLGDLPEPLVIAGDFNAAPWSHTVDLIAEATGTRITPGLRLSFQPPDLWPGLPIDHVLVSEDLVAATEMLGRAGSDHAGLITDLRFRR